MLPRLGVDYYCFHDVDVAPQGETLKEFQSNLDVISDKLLSKQKETGVKLFLCTMFLNSIARIATQSFCDVSHTRLWDHDGS